MKKTKGLLVTFLALALLVLGACGNNEKTSTENKGNEKKDVTLKISASSTPHAEILAFIAPDLEKEGVKLDVVITTDGIQANQQTAEQRIGCELFPTYAVFRASEQG